MRIIKEATGNEKLKENQYYSLMVVDLENRERRGKSDYLDFSKGWIGWERPTRSQPYISKSFEKRHNPSRGKTFVVEVQNNSGTIL